MKKSSKIVLGIVIALAIVLVIIVVFLAVCFVDMVNDVKEKIDKKQEITEIYDSIPEELFSKNILSDDFVYVDYDYGWTYESADTSWKYYFYIHSDDYEEYKHYWIESVSGSLNNNKSLSTRGDYVFKSVMVTDLCYSSDTNYGGVNLSANETYYLVTVYDEAIFYKYYIHYSEDKKYKTKAFNVNEESISDKYIFHQENGEWVIEEIFKDID